MQPTNLDDLISIACRTGKTVRIVVVEATDIYTIEAIKQARDFNLINPILTGDPKIISNILSKVQLSIPEAQIIHTKSAEDSVIAAIDLLKNSQADLLMKGNIPTKIFLKEILDPENGIICKKEASHLAIFESTEYPKLLGLTDAAMHISPGIHEKEVIINNAIGAFQKLGVTKPKVALLSAIESINAKMTSTTDAEILTNTFSKSHSGRYVVEGPLAFDIAISKYAADYKKYPGQITGDADILMVPEIVSGNILYKSLTYLCNAKVASVLLSSECPVILTSRAEKSESKMYSIALALCLQLYSDTESTSTAVYTR